MLTTTNFKLKKPESTDYAKISDLNDNADIIDAEIAKRPTRDDMDDVIDTKFTTSTSRAKLTPGEKLKALFGKIERWLEDLKDGAFSTVVNNVTTTDAGFVLDARQGKVLKDQIDTKANKADVVNNLTTTDYGYILDARQGKALNDKINDAKSSLDASIATKLASANIVNNVTTTNTGYALDARQGKALNDKIDSTRSSLQSSFQAGVDGIYNAITAQGTTPASKSQGDVKNAIKTLADAKYAAGHKGSAVASDVLAGKTFSNDSSVGISGSRVDLGSEPEMKGGTLYNGDVYLYPVSGGDDRNYGIQRGVHASPSNIAEWSGGTLFTRSQYDSNYSSGYSRGVSDADGRANSSSTNYKSGYNAGYDAGRKTVKSGSKDYNHVSNGTYSFTVPGTVVSAGISKITHGYDGRWTWDENNNWVSWSGNTVTFKLSVGVENASGVPNVTVSYAYY